MIQPGRVGCVHATGTATATLTTTVTAAATAAARFGRGGRTGVILGADAPTLDRAYRYSGRELPHFHVVDASYAGDVQNTPLALVVVEA